MTHPARDLAEQMHALAELLGIDPHTPWPEIARQARERLNREEQE